MNLQDTAIFYDGDSISAGFLSETPWGTRTSRLKGAHANVRAIGERRMTQLIAEYPTKMAPAIRRALSRYRRVIAICFEVRNEKQDGRTAVQIADLTHEYADLNLETFPESELWLASSPQDDGGVFGAGVTGEANDIVRTNWQAWGARGFLDFEAIEEMLPGGFLANADGSYVDLVHPSTAGHIRMAEYAASQL